MKTILWVRISSLGLCLFLFVCPARLAADVSYASKELFPLPPQLEDAVQFWIKIYSQIRTNEYVLHDAERLDVIYEVVRLDPREEERIDFHLSQGQQDLINQKKAHVAYLLAELASPETDFTQLTGEQRRIFDLFGGSGDRAVYAKAAANVRAQRGQRARFLRGIKLSGRYLDYMKRIFHAHGLPEELTVLPHVESSFNYHAYSSAGAAGIWQFTRPTGRRYLNITYEIDERLDPLLATEAAARLLTYNYEQCGSWPLAITAYNHGLEGMQRAMQLLNTSDIARIVARYESPYFGFASRNFYCEFLAALHVVQHYQDYFGKVHVDPPVRFREVVLPKYARITSLARQLGLPIGLISELNPALRDPIFSGIKYLPQGYRLRVPARVDAGPLVATIPSSEIFSAQKRTNWYRVRTDDTLAEIAQKHGTSARALAALNHLSNAQRINVGQVIRVPDTTRESVSSAPAKPLVASLSPASSKDDPRATASQPYKEDGPTAEKTREPEPESARGLSPALANAAPIPRPKVAKSIRPSMGHIRVEPDETLAHYADWLKVPTSDIRKWNHLPPKRNVRSGQWIKVVFKKVTPEVFNESRLEYHRGIEEDFYNNYKILGTITHRLKKGENIWGLCSQVYDVPYWLVIQYNHGLDLSAVRPGDAIVIPRISDGDRAS